MQIAETAVLNIKCRACGYSFKPYGAQSSTLPLKRIIECPSCKKTDEYIWLDSETRKKQLELELGLSKSEINPEISNKMEIMEKEIEILKQKIEIVISKVDSVKDWAKIREKDFSDIEKYAEQEREREKMEQDGI